MAGRDLFAETKGRDLFASPSAKPEEGFFRTPSEMVDELVGTMKTGASLASGAVAPIAGGWAGLAQAANPFAEPGAGAQAVEDVTSALTYVPKGDPVAERRLGTIAEGVGPLAEGLGATEEFLGGGALEATGSPLAATGAHLLPTVAMEALGLAGAKQGLTSIARRPTPPKEPFTFTSPAKRKVIKLIEEGSTDVATAKYELKKPQTALAKLIDSGPQLVKDKRAVEAIKQGFDEGVIAVVKTATPADKTKMTAMVNIMERGKKNKLFATTHRPSDIAGDSTLARFKTVNAANIKAGKRLDGVAKSLKGRAVDSSEPVNKFIGRMREMGIAFSDDLNPVFMGSDIEGVAASEKVIRNIMKRMKLTKVPDAYDVHRLKKFIDEQVTYGKSAEGLGGKVEGIAKQLRRELDTTLDTAFPEYNKVNTTYSTTREALDGLQDVAGKKMDLTGGNADKAVGTLLRRLMSNAQSRVVLLDVVNKLDDVARKNGGVFKDDLLTQVLFVDELDAVFGPVARTSFQGQIDQAVKQGAKAATTKTGAIDMVINMGAKVAEKARNINEDAAFKAIKGLLKK